MGPSRLGVRRRRAGVRHRCHYRADSPFATSRARSTATRVARKLARRASTGAKTIENGEGRLLSRTRSLTYPYVAFDDEIFPRYFRTSRALLLGGKGTRVNRRAKEEIMSKEAAASGRRFNAIAAVIPSFFSWI